MSGRRLGGGRALVGWVLTLATAHAVLHLSADLLPPLPTDPGALLESLAATDPQRSLFALIRAGALAVTWYLTVVTALGLLAHLAPLPRLRTLTDACTVAPVRRLLQAVAGPTLALAVAGGAAASLAPLAPAAPAAAVEQDATPTLRRLDTPLDPATPDPTTPILRRLDPPVTAPDPAPNPTPATDRWTVAPGEHLWQIATEVLVDAWGRPPDPADVVPFHRALIAANADRLVVPGEPDLILPGQELVLPAVPGDPQG